MAHKIKKLSWISPLEISQKIAQNHDEDWVFLFSGLSEEMKNSKSIIAIFKNHDLKIDDLSDLKNHLKNDSKNYENAYFGYVSYEYKNKLESFKGGLDSPLNLPNIHLASFSLILEFDHEKEAFTAFYEQENQLEEVLGYEYKEKKVRPVKLDNLSSNFSSEEYIEAIKDVKKDIASGDFYQTNLTRKFHGKFNISEQSEFFEIFKRLSESSAANFSSFIRFGENFIISASPELFFQVSDSKIISRPIKGTSPRSEDKIQDQKNKEYLTTSEKEKAENLMIVDLVRNDLSRVCEASSIKVDNLFQINSYKTLHHLSSEVCGKLQSDKDVIDAFDATFPAGSMTGAPKIKAIEKAAALERFERGVYSGAIGYFKNPQEAMFSVVIRTLICKKNEFEFQVGGAITFDSDEQKELEETFVKAKAICEILNIKLES